GGDPFGCLIAVGATIALGLVARGPSEAVGLGRAVLVAGGLALVLAAVQLLPAAAAAPGSARAYGYSFEAATRFSLWPPELVGLVIPCAFGLPQDDAVFLFQSVAPDFSRAWFNAVYVGPIAFALAVAGAARARRDPLARAGLVLVAVFLP